MSEKYVWEVFDKDGKSLGFVTAVDIETATKAASSAWYGKFGHLGTEHDES